MTHLTLIEGGAEDDPDEFVELIGEGDWKTRGSCIDLPSNLFFPGKGESHRDAQRVCATCPVRQECLEYALANGIKFGIWGGESERGRRAIRKQRLADAATQDGAA